MNETVVVESFLDQEEANQLTAALSNIGIKTILKTMTEERTDPYFNIFIKIEDVEKAESVIREYRTKRSKQIEELNRFCPKCKSTIPLIIQNRLPFWKRILSLGTVPMICLKCGKEWYV